MDGGNSLILFGTSGLILKEVKLLALSFLKSSLTMPQTEFQSHFNLPRYGPQHYTCRSTVDSFFLSLRTHTCIQSPGGTPTLAKKGWGNRRSGKTVDNIAQKPHQSLVTKNGHLRSGQQPKIETTTRDITIFRPFSPSASLGRSVSQIDEQR